MISGENTDQLAKPSEFPSRRRFIGGGVAVTVLASLKSGSVLAAGHCLSPSAFSSIALNTTTSAKPSAASLPTCHSQGYWKNTSQPWPIDRATTVAGAGFSPQDVSNVCTGTTTLQQLLDQGGGGARRATAADLVSAYLDALSVANVPFTVAHIRYMWSTAFGSASVPPWGGQPWTSRGVRAFLDVLVGKPNPYY